jgi:hypothetical protein
MPPEARGCASALIGLATSGWGIKPNSNQLKKPSPRRSSTGTGINKEEYGEVAEDGKGSDLALGATFHMAPEDPNNR